MPMSVSDNETAEVCVPNLHMHTFLMVVGILDGLHHPPDRPFFLHPSGTRHCKLKAFGKVWLWGVGDLLIR